MRIAAGVVGLVLMLPILFQSCAAGVGGALSPGRTDMAQGGAVGVVVAFGYLLGAAFSFALPVVGAVFFGVAGLLALAAGATTAYTDLTVWGVVALLLAGLDLLAARRRKPKPAPPPTVPTA